MAKMMSKFLFEEHFIAINLYITDSTLLNEKDDPHPSLGSLSDWHDYEPNLEFDDSELTQIPPDLNDCNRFIFESNGYVSDEFNSAGSNLEEKSQFKTSNIINLEEENFEEHLKPPDIDEDVIRMDFCRRNFIDCLGNDKFGRPIIAIYSTRLPESKNLNPSIFIDFIINVLDDFVQNDYVLVYFNSGTGYKDSKPSFAFLWNSYKELDRNFKKNLKQLYVVHPTSFIKIIWFFFKPMVSRKFKSKLFYISSIEELKELLGQKNLTVPGPVLE